MWYFSHFPANKHLYHLNECLMNISCLKLQWIRCALCIAKTFTVYYMYNYGFLHCRIYGTAGSRRSANRLWEVWDRDCGDTESYLTFWHAATFHPQPPTTSSDCSAFACLTLQRTAVYTPAPNPLQMWLCGGEQSYYSSEWTVLSLQPSIKC